jgi:hypothetical protein
MSPIVTLHNSHSSVPCLSVPLSVSVSVSLLALISRLHSFSLKEKFGNFIFRLKTKSGGYQGLGVCQLPLHTYAARYQPVDETLSLTKCTYDGITAFITMTPKVLDDSPDDTASNLSGCTDHTTGAADFNYQFSETGSDMGDGEDDDMMVLSLSHSLSLSHTHSLSLHLPHDPSVGSK